MPHTQLLAVPALLRFQSVKENVPMNLVVLCAFIVIAAVSLIGTRPGHVWASFASILKVLPVLALACLAFTAAPLHAQDKARAPVHKVPPVYPLVARQMGISGSITVSTTVDPSGKVIKAESPNGSKLFVAAAIEAVKQWKFAPAASTDTFPVTVNFQKD
jgi:TonB family protein